MELKYQDVNAAFKGIVEIFSGQNVDLVTGKPPCRILSTNSRAGKVLQIMEPVTVTYENPTRRVLFNAARDCNPFFHVYESLWMLAGRNDVAPLEYYSSKIGDVASDDGETFNGAYGYRWRKAARYVKHYEGFETSQWLQDTDQLQIVIDQLKRKSESRRTVLQMWNVSDDLLKIDTTKDVCCNTAAYFLVRKGEDQCLACKGHGGGYVRNEETRVTDWHECQNCAGIGHIMTGKHYLDMTVTNRSNDAIWGMLGANVVHFSFLQEYLAANIGVEVGKYYQFTNNLHVYTENNSGFKPEAWLSDATENYYDNGVSHVPLIEDPEVFEKELPEFVELMYSKSGNYHKRWNEPFLQSVAAPMCWAYELHKKRDYEMALETVKLITARDWRIACRNWITTRKWNYRNSQKTV